MGQCQLLLQKQQILLCKRRQRKLSKQVKQFRYYSPGNLQNDLKNVDAAGLITGEALENYQIVQLGIQTLPGTQFILGNSNKDNPITIGQTGIFELDVSNLSTNISGIKILPSSMKNIITNPIGYIIIDIVYEEGGASS